DEKIYWFVAKNLPDLFDYLFVSLQEQGNQVGSLTGMPNDYPESKVLEYIEAEKPSAILATHYGAAQVLGTLRERGHIPGIRIGWLHTDYFEGYFPRISKRIDRTFLAHPELESRWLKAGVDPELIETTGMPVSIPADDENGSKEYLTRIGLDPNIKTITIAGGKEGAGDFRDIITRISAEVKEPLQILAVCGRNEKQRRTLFAMQNQIPAPLKLAVMGLIPQADLVSFIRASDVFITKAGGLSPAEAFTLGKPTILLNVISGHERENAELFSKMGMAEFNRDIKEVGRQVLMLLYDQKKQASMLAAQAVYRANINIEKIARFALDSNIQARHFHPNFGVENGRPALKAHSILQQLERDAPADMEILLSYSSSKDDERIVLENPFGHIALRIGEVVYSTNHMADPLKDSSLLQHIGLEQYLFGTLPPSENQVHTSTYGMSYGRDTLGLRVKGVTPAAMKLMQAEVSRIEEDFRARSCKWDRKNANCADFVALILRSGGYDIERIKGPNRIFAMPLDIFENIRAIFENDPRLQTELVAYRRLPGSQAAYRFSKFPLSLWKPARALVQVVTDGTPEIEKNIGRQLTGYIGDERICYENLKPRLSVSELDNRENSRRYDKSIERILVEEARQLIVKETNIFINEQKQKIDTYLVCEAHNIVDRCLDAVSISVKFTEGVFETQNIKKIRRLFADPEFVNNRLQFAKLIPWRGVKTTKAASRVDHSEIN
ncbi:MAG: glycosyltransferase, partial [Smithella sp.]